MKIATFLLAATSLLLIGGQCLAQPAEGIDVPPARGERAAVEADVGPAYAHPTLPAGDHLWVGPMMIVVVAMFLVAAIIGFVHDSEMPHEEPGAAGGHGHGHSHDDHGHADHAHH